jgi:hypothetical protein
MHLNSHVSLQDLTDAYGNYSIVSCTRRHTVQASSGLVPQNDDWFLHEDMRSLFPSEPVPCRLPNSGSRV